MRALNRISSAILTIAVSLLALAVHAQTTPVKVTGFLTETLSGKRGANSKHTDAAANTYSSGTTPGGAVADSYATLLYYHPDHLTARLTTDNSGQVSNQQGHFPFGEDWYSTGTADPSVNRKFTTYLQDDEAYNAKLHYAQARENSVRLARFQTADPVRGRISNPQRLNRYSYVMGDPINRRDPNGRAPLREPYLMMDAGPGRGVWGGGSAFCDHVAFSSTCSVLAGCGGWDALGLENCNGGGNEGGQGGGLGQNPPHPIETQVTFCWCVLLNPAAFAYQGIGCSYGCSCQDDSFGALYLACHSWNCFYKPCPILINIERMTGLGVNKFDHVVFAWPWNFCCRK
jgi:RHS repeat-associated protein